MIKLLDDYPLILLPNLAVEIGLNEAIMLQQVHWLCKRPDNPKQKDGKPWVYNTPEGWRKWFPFFSESTIRRTLDELRARGFLISEQLAGPTKPMHYRVSDNARDLLTEVKEGSLILSEQVAQNEQGSALKLSNLYIDTDSNKEIPAASAGGKKKREKESDAHPEHAQFVKDWITYYRLKTNEEYPFQAKDGQAAKRLLKHFGEAAKLKEFIKACHRREAEGYPFSKLDSLCMFWSQLATLQGALKQPQRQNGHRHKVLDKGACAIPPEQRPRSTWDPMKGDLPT